jgi:hypothetical protein
MVHRTTQSRSEDYFIIAKYGGYSPRGHDSATLFQEPLQIIDSDYSFDQILSDYDSVEELQMAIARASQYLPKVVATESKCSLTY